MYVGQLKLGPACSLGVDSWPASMPADMQDIARSCLWQINKGGGLHIFEEFVSVNVMPRLNEPDVVMRSRPCMMSTR